ncbi:FAD:protein FMN transferase [Sphingosinithalassobacter portus]|uniref:FAD:protein FMN transferase n=1 Tax=Stakelama portus TaxID=2676234 RepID=UPI000D6E35CD|nr:FAD:protein FMN transferase [Sphingosinithalassobacter portus]
MGTQWSARIVVPPSGLPAATGRAITRSLDGVIAEMSHWDPASDIRRVNQDRHGGWQSVPPAFAHVLAAAIDVSERSKGAFDPAMGRLADLWGFGPSGPRTSVPDDVAIAEAMAASGVSAVEFDRARLRLRRTRPVHFDFSGIAKGYAVDALADALRTLGLTDFLVEIGGELIGEGIKPDGQPWWVALEQPPGITAPPIRIALHGVAVATSGDYVRGFDMAGRRYAHTLDPRTGRPITHGVVSVSVIHRECMLADAWATALTVLGPDAGMALATRQELAAHMLVRTGETISERVSPAFAQMLG